MCAHFLLLRDIEPLILEVDTGSNHIIHIMWFIVGNESR